MHLYLFYPNLSAYGLPFLLQVLSGEQELSELAQVSGYNESVQPS